MSPDTLVQVVACICVAALGLLSAWLDRHLKSDRQRSREIRRRMTELYGLRGILLERREMLICQLNLRVGADRRVWSRFCIEWSRFCQKWTALQREWEQFPGIWTEGIMRPERVAADNLRVFNENLRRCEVAGEIQATAS